MSQTLKQIVGIFKEQLMRRNLESNKSAILGIKQCLQKTVEDDSVVDIILDLDIQQFLLHLLIKSNYSVSLDILKCLELLCSYKLYFTRDHAVETAEIILKNLFNLVNDHNYDNILIESLKIITIIIDNLDNYYSKNKLSFKCYLDTTRNLLLNKKDPKVICAIIKMSSALLLHEKFQNNIDDNIFKDIEVFWQLSLQKLHEIFQTDATSSVVGVSKLCASILRMLTKILIYKKDNIVKFYENVQASSVNCLKFVCIPYIAEFCTTTTGNVCLEYLCFVETLLKSNLSKNILVDISQKLVNDFNFTVIAKYLDNINSVISNSEEQQKTRQVCLMILCEITVNLSDMSSCSLTEDKCKKYMFKYLKTITSSDVNNWIYLLNDSVTNRETKLVIIKFCTMYYVYANNLWEIQQTHLFAIIGFLKGFSIGANVTSYVLKDLWLLFAVICCSIPEEMNENFGLFKATSNLERLIFMNEKSFDKILTYHPSIISWIFLNPFVKKELIYIVMNRWLLRASTDASARCALLHVVSTWRTAATMLLDVLQYGDAPLNAAAADILRAALEKGSLAQDQEFVQQLCVAVPYNIQRLSQQEVVRDRVVTCIYMLHLSSYVHTPTDHSLLVYSVRSFTSCVGSLGLSDILPPIFYSNAFDYASTILAVAKENEINQVYMTFMNSEPMLYTLMTALVSGNQELSIKASQLFNNLLEYQTNHRLYCRNTMIIKKDSLVKLLCVPNIEHLQLNLQILKTLLFKTAKSVLDLEIDENILKGLYFRCLNLVTKPGAHNLGQFGLKCMEGILKYSHVHKQNCLDYLCHHPGNHVMILSFYDNETCRPIDKTFLSFIQCLLYFVSKNKEKMYNKLSITFSFWQISLFQIADLIVRNSVYFNEEFGDIINNILRQLFQFSDLLPPPLSNCLRNIEENLNELLI